MARASLPLGVLLAVIAGCGGGTGDQPTVEVLGELAIGMTTDEVTETIGEPETRFDQPPPGGDPTAELWGYDTADAKVAVYFSNGRVADFRGTDRIVQVPGGASD